MRTPRPRHTSWALLAITMTGLYFGIKLLTGDVNRACQSHVRFPDGAEEGAVVNQPSDAVVDHNFPQVLVVQDVGVYERA